MSSNFEVPQFDPLNLPNVFLGCKFHPCDSLQNRHVNSSWTSAATHHPPHTPPSLYPLLSHLYSSAPAIGNLGEVRTRLALVAVLYSVTVAAVISPAVSRLASGANITALDWTLPTPHELNMDKHTRQLTGRESWGGDFTETSGNHFILWRLPIGGFRWAVKLQQKSFREGRSSRSCFGLQMKYRHVYLPQRVQLTCERSLLSSSRIRTFVSSCLM